MLHIYTYSTSPEKAQFLFRSAELHSLKVENLATKETWGGWQDRIDAIYAKVKTLQDSDIFCFIDSYDLLVNADEEKIVSVFKSFDKPIVFGAESLLFPFSLKSRESEYPSSPTPFRFLNAGCFIGYVHAIKRIYEWGVETKKFPAEDDQGFYQTFFLEHKDDISLDYHTKFAINMNKVPWNTLVIENGAIQFTPMNTTPCFFHFNGMSYLDKHTDLVNMGNNQFGFSYDKVYERTFLALLGAKFVSKRSPLCLQLTSQGHSY